VRGQVSVTLVAEQHPRGITLQAVGTEFTNWGVQPSFIARTHCLDRSIDLWKPQREGEALPPGTHAFPFAIELPPTLPPSFDGLLTEIGYGLKAKVDLPRHVDLHAEAGFIVVATLPAVEDKPVHIEARDDTGRYMALDLPRTVYRLGQTIEGVVHLTRPREARARRLTVELLSRERGNAQGVWTDYVEREADVRIELEHVVEDSAYPFTFKLPDSAAPTYSGEHSELSWRVVARLDAPRSPDLIAEAGIVVGEVG